MMNAATPNATQVSTQSASPNHDGSEIGGGASAPLGRIVRDTPMLDTVAPTTGTPIATAPAINPRATMPPGPETPSVVHRSLS